MNIGSEISNIRKERGLTREEFGKIFHVTRQTVSNWENEKSYPDLQMLVEMSEMFEISLDTLLKEDWKMVKTMDKERTFAKTIIVCIIGVALILGGWGLKSSYDKMVMKYLEEHEQE